MVMRVCDTVDSFRGVKMSKFILVCLRSNPEKALNKYFFNLNISRACTLKVGAEFCFIAPSY